MQLKAFMKGNWEHAAGNTLDTRHDWHCIKDEANKQIAHSGFILDLQKELQGIEWEPSVMPGKISEGGWDIKQEGV